MKTILSSFLILFVFIISSCEGPQGEPGPAGTQGAAGTQGPAGPAGPAGKINFIATEWIKSDNNILIKNYDPATLTTGGSLTDGGIEKISQADLNKGIVLVYDTYEEDKSVINALPYDYVFDDNHVWFSYGASKSDKSYVNLYTTFAKNVDPQKFYSEITGGNMWYRVIIIPAVAGGRLKGLDLRDYKAVKAYLGLKD